MPETKEALQRRITELEAEVADLREELKARNAVASTTSEPGWLFTTKNPNYSGWVYGVHFEGGRAFLPKGHKGARLTMQRIVSDFGYDVTEITAKDFELLDPRAAGPEDNGRKFVETVAPPGVMG